MVVVAYGLILPKAVLDTPRLGCINVHGSLLPRWRGAARFNAPSGRGCRNRRHHHADGRGAGHRRHDPQVTCPIASDETSASLYDKLAGLGPQALVDTLDAMAAGDTAAEPQDDALANYAEKLSRKRPASTGRWTPLPSSAASVPSTPGPSAGSTSPDRPSGVAGRSPSPGARPGSRHPAQGRQAGIEVATGQGVLRLLTLQPPGKKAMSVSDLLNSRRDWFEPGTQLI